MIVFGMRTFRGYSNSGSTAAWVRAWAPWLLDLLLWQPACEAAFPLTISIQYVGSPCVSPAGRCGSGRSICGRLRVDPEMDVAGTELLESWDQSRTRNGFTIVTALSSLLGHGGFALGNADQFVTDLAE